MPVKGIVLGPKEAEEKHKRWKAEQIEKATDYYAILIERHFEEFTTNDFSIKGPANIRPDLREDVVRELKHRCLHAGWKDASIEFVGYDDLHIILTK